MINVESDRDSVESTTETIINVIAGYYFMVQYLWINVCWVILILYGLIKKKKEFTAGGVYAVLFSLGLFLIVINS